MAGRRPSFKVGDRVRYRPGVGVYGYEDSVEADGRVPAVVRGFTRTRVRVELTLGGQRKGFSKKCTVDAESLKHAT